MANIDRDFLYLEDTRSNDDDRYGDRLQLSLEPVPAVVPGQSLAILATLQLDGQRVPVVPFPSEPGNEPVRQKVAIAAAVLIDDVDQDLDRLLCFPLQQETPQAMGGRVHLDDLGPGTYGLRVVARVLNFGGRQLRHAVRVVRGVVNIGGSIEQQGIDAVWLVEHLGPAEGRRSIRANLRHLDPGGERAVVTDVRLHASERLPLSFPIEKRAVAIAPDQEDGLFVLSARDGGRSRLFEAETDGSFSGPEPFDFDSQVFGHSTSVESWVANPQGIGRYFGGALVTQFDGFTKVRAIAGLADSTFWTVCGDRALAGSGSIYLRRIDENGNTVAEARAVSEADTANGSILRAMADGGVMVYGRYRREYRVVRVGPGGNVVAVSDLTPANVLDLAVNPFTGEALIVHAAQLRRAELVFLDVGLAVSGTLAPGDGALGKAFEAIHSAEISAPPAGQRIWISGQRKELQPSGIREIRGAVGYLDADGTFHLVRGGMAPISLLRALW